MEYNDQCPEERFAELLEDIYASSRPRLHPLTHEIAELERISLDELQPALARMKNRKCADEQEIVIEIIKYGNDPLHTAILHFYKEIISHGHIPEHWQSILFTMIPKSGDLSSPSNWRPIAVLPVLYKVFSGILYNRILPIWDRHQSHGQTGFRPGVRIEEALCVAEIMIGNTLEYYIPIWIASLDLRKAFDRVEHDTLFSVVRNQGTDGPMIHLLLALYHGQVGSANQSRH